MKKISLITGITLLSVFAHCNELSRFSVLEIIGLVYGILCITALLVYSMDAIFDKIIDWSRPAFD